MKIWSKTIRGLCRDEQGATAVEYGLIAGLIAIAIVAGATLLGTNLNTAFDFIAGKVNVGAAS